MNLYIRPVQFFPKKELPHQKTEKSLHTILRMVLFDAVMFMEFIKKTAKPKKMKLPIQKNILFQNLCGSITKIKSLQLKK